MEAVNGIGFVPIVAVALARQSQLAQIAQARRHPRLLSHFSEHGKQHRHQDGDDRNHDQQFNERE
ncbi:MAG: hypothetical protein SLRJCFUN_001832, partial [Candidatus Fervidibacter sp.]